MSKFQLVQANAFAPASVCSRHARGGGGHDMRCCLTISFCHTASLGRPLVIVGVAWLCANLSLKGMIASSVAWPGSSAPPIEDGGPGTWLNFRPLVRPQFISATKGFAFPNAKRPQDPPRVLLFPLPPHGTPLDWEHLGRRSIEMQMGPHIYKAAEMLAQNMTPDGARAPLLALAFATTIRCRPRVPGFSGTCKMHLCMYDS